MGILDNLSELWRMGRKEKKRGALDLRGLARIYRAFARQYAPYRRVLLVAYLALFANIAVTLLEPWPLKLALDHVIERHPLPGPVDFLEPDRLGGAHLTLLILGLSLIGIEGLKAILGYVSKFLISSTGIRVIADIRERVFAHLQRLSLSFHESARSGNVVYLMTSDVKEMKNLLIDFPQDLTSQLLMTVFCLAVMFVLDWRLALIALAALPGLVLFTKVFGAGVRKALKKKREQEGEVASIIAENVTAMALVQAYGRETSEERRLVTENKASLQAQLRALRLERTYNRLSDLVVTLAWAAVLYLGGRLALRGDLLPGTLVAFVLYLKTVYGSLDKFTVLFPALARSQVAGERLLDVVESDMVVESSPDQVPAPPFEGRVELRGVSFAYRTGEEVLHDVSFVVEPGEKVALVGHSGAGKSTLISLLLRFHDPTKGRILIDGRDVRSFTLQSLREQVTILFQDARLFRETVRENIAFGKRGATDAEIVEAAKLAGAHDFIMEMPDGYDTLMLEGGDNLSGGQKQRINIARAIIRRTPILILDEPVAGLDARTEAGIREAMRRLMAGRTSFIVAHKLVTIEDADRILVLDRGRLLAEGRHEELLRTCSYYRELQEIQRGVAEGIGGAGAASASARTREGD